LRGGGGVGVRKLNFWLTSSVIVMFLAELYSVET
jgi:hypothetical protein